jgi:hypothetical protein
MARRKLTRLGLAALAVIVAAAVAVPAFAAAPPAKRTLRTIGGAEFKANRFVKDTMRFSRDVTVIRRGGKLILRDRTKQPHTFSVVRKGQIPSTMREMENCFGAGPCDDLAVAHGAINPDTGEEQDPTTPLVNVGREGFNQPGDSVLIPPNGKVTVDITGRRDLNYLCAIHPWMLGKIDVRRAG